MDEAPATNSDNGSQQSGASVVGKPEKTTKDFVVEQVLIFHVKGQHAREVEEKVLNGQIEATDRQIKTKEQRQETRTPVLPGRAALSPRLVRRPNNDRRGNRPAGMLQNGK